MSGDLFGWKNRKTGSVHQYKASDIVRAQWLHTGSDAYQLRILLAPHKNDQIVRFDGFHEKNYVELRRHFEEVFNVKLLRVQQAHRGWHWGNVQMDGNNLRFTVGGLPGLDLHAQEIAQVTTPSKNDLAIELIQDDTRDQAEDQLLEIRFYQPFTGDEDAEGALQQLKQKLVKKSGVAETKMDSIALLNDVPLLVPRGRYEIDIGRRALKFHGKSYDYTIQYSSINRMFLVPRPNSPHVNFILSLENAMRQGQTSYPFVVMQFDSDAVQSVEVNLEENELTQRGLEKLLEGKTFDVVTRLFRALVGKSVIVPGDFKSVKQQFGITCSHRAQSGHLYPLNRSFLFIVKPVIFIRYDDVVSVEFSRTGASTTNRFFAFTVSVRGGGEFEFTSIDRNEYLPLVEFLQGKGIRIKNQEVPEGGGRGVALEAADLPSDDDEDDDDYHAGASDSEEEDEDFREDDDEDDEEEDASESEEEEDTKKSKKRKKKEKKSKKDKKRKKD
ncbi:structure specific recognition protein [Cystoisospora suis]|uniref:FACT complex subunit SSRP1 n=1 Tax=Cystoisospora suis TaxID=483139 RepID=A0A2C6KT85_9APIC|nr:structure specific recognition protein [Cystoisospora suis]